MLHVLWLRELLRRIGSMSLRLLLCCWSGLVRVLEWIGLVRVLRNADAPQRKLLSSAGL